eukprot:scaffold24121_cov72-Phaeocystis_antarctica.AAC.3
MMRADDQQLPTNVAGRPPLQPAKGSQKPLAETLVLRALLVAQPGICPFRSIPPEGHESALVNQGLHRRDDLVIGPPGLPRDDA